MSGFIFDSLLLGVGLAMDAFSVSAVNAMREPGMRIRKKVLIAGTFALFQFFMPLIGWQLVRAAEGLFAAFVKAVPWIALILLLYIGGKMLCEGIRDCRKPSAEADSGQNSAENEVDINKNKGVGCGELLVQGIATSIDALSVGFAIAAYSGPKALAAGGIIAAVTFVICMAGIRLGKRFGLLAGSRASIFGGLVLIGIGLKIFFVG